MRLSPEGARIIGSLVEKELTTPDQYPLTITSLLAACNQASNRDPVVVYDEHAVTSALNELKEQRLVRFVLPSHGRTAVRYRHVLPEALALDQRQSALVAVLLLRGPQTIGELRSRTERMTDFDGLDEVEHELRFLSNIEEPLATSLGRRPGQKEERWICPIAETSLSSSSRDQSDDQFSPDTGRSGEAQQSRDPGPSRDAAFRETEGDVVGAVTGYGANADNLGDELRAELAVLRTEIGDVRRDLQALRESLGE